MPTKLNKAGNQQPYVPKGNGDESGEYRGSDGSTNISQEEYKNRINSFKEKTAFQEKVKSYKEKYNTEVKQSEKSQSNIFKIVKDAQELKKLFGKEEQKLNSRITKKQIGAIEFYTDYTGYDVNDYLRGATVFDKQPKELSLIKESIEELDTIINDFNLKEDIITYRAIDYDKVFGNIPPKYLVGQKYIDEGYMSTTPLLSAAKEFSKEYKLGDYYFEIKLKKGKGKSAYINQHSMHKNVEYELLMKRKSKMKITGYREENDMVIIEMEEV